ncbi:hypothetical protein DY000_02018225 [Brassica cretica]|uniref:Uncharacterized protein n=1 Tax=Brassica cretica TaxID=69181 RepID=A0ABQ7CSB6_BRACR|nr:hypothetical protein DY000_02018225 [Brassica cretica]
MTEVLHFPSAEQPSSCIRGEEEDDVDEEDQQISLLAFRRSLVYCKISRRELCSMEIGWPTSVRHVAFEPEGSQKRSRYVLQSLIEFVLWSKMDDPMTGLMYAVQVMMNFLKMLIKKTLRERQVL